MIPKIIHQIWLGGISAPISLMMSWRKHHPSWDYRYCNDDSVPRGLCHVQLSQTTRLCKRADIIRLELLYQYGGIYADCDFLCQKPFDDLLDVPFFAGYQWVYKNGSGIICNALIGCEPRHPFILSLLHEIQKLSEKECTSHAAVNLTGPYLLSRMWRNNPVGVIHPPAYFYPISDKQFIEGKLPANWKSLTENSYALHLWGAQFSTDYL